MSILDQKNVSGYVIAFVGACMAPLLPFLFLIIIPLVVVLCGAPVVGLLFAILIDSFLLSDGLVPFYVSPVFYTALSLPLYVYLRYTAS